MKLYTLEIRPEDEPSFIKHDQKEIPKVGESIEVSKTQVQIVDRTQSLHVEGKLRDPIIIFTKKE